MTKDEAKQHALGYACGREDASGTRTLGDTMLGPGALNPARDGWLRFADAYAQGWDDFNHQRRISMTNAKDAYDRWQASNGRSIFPRGELTLNEDQRAELRGLWPSFWNGDNDTSAYYAWRDQMQDAAWDVLS